MTLAAGQKDHEENKAWLHLDCSFSKVPSNPLPSNMLRQTKYPATAMGENIRASNSILFPNVAAAPLLAHCIPVKLVVAVEGETGGSLPSNSYHA
jgi:hypothetical protein